MTSYIGSSHPRQLHITSVANDVLHDAALTEVKSKQPDGVFTGVFAGHQYTTFFENDEIILKFNGNSVMIVFKSTKYVTFTFTSRNWSSVYSRIVSPNTDYYSSGQTYQDSSYFLNDIQEIRLNCYDSTYGYGDMSDYRIKMYNGYYKTRWEVVRHDP